MASIRQENSIITSIFVTWDGELSFYDCRKLHSTVTPESRGDRVWEHTGMDLRSAIQMRHSVHSCTLIVHHSVANKTRFLGG